MATYAFRRRIETSNLGKKKVFLFSDFDGTLTPICEDPAKCFLSFEIKTLLKRLINSGKFNLCILSGRKLDDLKKRINLKKIYYGGNHGLVITGPGIRFLHPEAKRKILLLICIREQLKKEVKKFEGVWIEDKKFSISLHYRNAKRKDIPLIKRLFYKTFNKFIERGEISVIKGKKVIEIIPTTSWDKGKAVVWILNRFKERFLPIYIGDDKTDEKAFDVLYRMGITICVGRSKNTKAKYYLKNQKEVVRLLYHIMNNNSLW